MSTPSAEATVLRVDRKRVVVETDEGEILGAALRGRVHRRRGRTKSPVAVGDRVTIENTVISGAAPHGSGSGPPVTAVITAVGERRSWLLRPEASGRWRNQILVANADRAILVFAHADPRPHAGLVDRLLVACHAGEVPPLLVFNKTDLPPDESVAELIDLYDRLGYELVRSCANTGEGVERLRELTLDRCSVFAGPSGTGKSSLINRVLPGVELRTGEISRATRKGKHTTTASCLVRIPGSDGHIIDTPGIKEFGITAIEPTELDLHFPEFPVPNQCRFLDCRHASEPGCAVLAAVAAGTVARTRHGSYLAFRAELEEKRAW